MRCGSHTNRTVRNPHGSVHPTNRTATPRFGSGRARTATVCHGSPRFAKPPQSTTVFHGSRYFFTRFSHPQQHIKSVFHLDQYSRTVFSDSHIVNTLFAYLIAFSLHLHPHSAPTPSIPRILAYDRIIISFTHSPHLADAVLQFSYTHSI